MSTARCVRNLCRHKNTAPSNKRCRGSLRTIAIDFETANPRPGNACALGLAWIEGGRVTRIEERLIRPREMRFTFTWVHGITAADVREAPEFPEVFEEFRPDLKGALLLAHNASFDAGVMRGCARAYGMKSPRLSYLCTLGIARSVWPELRSKSLDNVARHLGFKFRQTLRAMPSVQR